MKRKLAAKLCLLGLLCVAFVCGVSIAIDPYNVFHWSSVRDNGVEPNKNYVKTQYILHHPEKYDTFIFGNSRVGSMDAAKIGDTCYNMYYSEGLPAESYENLRAFLDAGVQVRRVYLGIDDVSCFVDPSIHDDQLIRRPFRADEAELLFLLDYLDASVALQSLETICAYTGEEPAFHERLYSTGNYYLDTQLTAESLAQEEWPNYFAWYGGEALADIAQIRELCVENGVELVVFVNPEFYVRWDEAVERGYLDFLEQLAQVTDFYSFGGHNSVTCSMENFHDISHYKPQVGDSMIYLLEQGIGENGGKADADARQTWSDTLGDEERQRIESLRDEGFGQYVTAENIQDYLAKLQGGRQ